MTDPEQRGGGKQLSIEAAMDLPERGGKCAYYGRYVDDGETVCHFGEEYICRAPNLVPTGNEC